MNRKVAGVAVAVVAMVMAGFGATNATGQNAVTPLERDCSNTEHTIHTGFQTADNACVETAFGDQSKQNQNPSLIIVDAPRRIRANQPLTIEVSTRNLIRDRFLPAAQGGYYLESATLNDAGLTRGHFHTACRPINRRAGAPEPVRNAVFQATEDGGGGSAPDTVEVTFENGLPAQGTWQCAAWAGDGSHRTPMMAFPNQIPAIDTVQIAVRCEMRTDKRDKRDLKERELDED